MKATIRFDSQCTRWGHAKAYLRHWLPVWLACLLVGAAIGTWSTNRTEALLLVDLAMLNLILDRVL